jgi:hypothetical protein
VRIDTVNIHIAHPGAMAAAGIAAFLRASADVSTQATPTQGEIPAIGDPWPGPGVGGIYAGLSRAADGEPDAHLVLLTSKPDKKLPWKDAVAWASTLGDGAHLPTRDESAVLYAHLRGEFADGWHWTSTQYSESSPGARSSPTASRTATTRSTRATPAPSADFPLDPLILY